MTKSLLVGLLLMLGGLSVNADDTTTNSPAVSSTPTSALTPASTAATPQVSASTVTTPPLAPAAPSTPVSSPATVSTTTASPAADPANAPTPGVVQISEAFGVKLGDTFDPTSAIGQGKLTDGTPMYQFSPVKTFRSFTEYYVLITPQTHKIYTIWAQGQFDNTETAKKEQALIMELLKEKYGESEKQGMFDALSDVSRIDHGNRYVLTKISGFSTATFDIRYCDAALTDQAEKERLAIEAKKVDSGSL